MAYGHIAHARAHAQYIQYSCYRNLSAVVGLRVKAVTKHNLYQLDYKRDFLLDFICEYQCK